MKKNIEKKYEWTREAKKSSRNKLFKKNLLLKLLFTFIAAGFAFSLVAGIYLARSSWWR